MLELEIGSRTEGRALTSCCRAEMTSSLYGASEGSFEGGRTRLEGFNSGFVVVGEKSEVWVLRSRKHAFVKGAQFCLLGLHF
jgi:hypothetical protein